MLRMPDDMIDCDPANRSSPAASSTSAGWLFPAGREPTARGVRKRAVGRAQHDRAFFGLQHVETARENQIEELGQRERSRDRAMDFVQRPHPRRIAATAGKCRSGRGGIGAVRRPNRAAVPRRPIGLAFEVVIDGGSDGALHADANGHDPASCPIAMSCDAHTVNNGRNPAS
jgi:hypothetical protein